MPSSLVGRPGEDVEAVVSILLCRRHERAARRRPGQGDRGVDVAVPADHGRIDVYQVKRYDRSLTSGQWAKIKASYETLVNAVADGHVAVRNWYLVMPLDQSEADAGKFDQLVADGPFELCEWRGLAWLDALASEYPEVVDYYLGDGKARLEQAQRDLMRILDTRDAAVGAANVAATSDGLNALHRSLNRHDPLYRYDFAVGSAADRDSFIPTDPPRSLVFSAQVSDGDVCVTWHVHARCDESVRERQIPIGVRFDVSGDPAVEQALRLFVDYGAPLRTPHGTASISMDLPGGLGGTRESGSVWIGPTAEDAARTYVMRLREVRPDGRIGAPVRLRMSAPTVGARGARLSGEHDGGAFSFEAFHDFEPPAMTVHFSGLELTGRPVADVIDGVEFLYALDGSQLEVAAEHGPFMPFGDAPRSNSDDVRVGEADPAGTDLEALRVLAALQEHTPTTLLVPDFDRVTRGQLREWGIVARVLAGETVTDGRLGELKTELRDPPVGAPDGEHAFCAVTDLVVEVGEQRVTFGQQVLYNSAAHVSSDATNPAGLTVTPRPGVPWTRTAHRGG